jgi:hypothetical protein
MTVSKSPGRMTFQKEKYIERCKDEGKEPDTAHLEMYENFLERYDARFETEESKASSMEYDLLTTPWILEKVRASKVYAQNLYASMCNNDFQRIEMWPILTDQKWSCSWRYAGGIIADMRQEGDYIDWYCSGIRDIDSPDNGFVSESTVTEDIENDLRQLGWLVIKD